MGMGCPFHCSGDRATSTLPTSNKTSGKETTLSRQKIGEKSKLYSLSEEHQDENEPEEEHLSLKTLATAVRVLTSPPMTVLLRANNREFMSDRVRIKRVWGPRASSNMERKLKNFLLRN